MTRAVAVGAGDRLEQTQLLVEVHRPDGLADRLGELAYTQKLGMSLFHRLPAISDPYVKVRV